MLNNNRLIVLLIAISQILIPATASAAQICPANLRAEVEKITQNPKLKSARVGVAISTLSTSSTQPQTLVSLDGDKFFIPASNAKLFTTATALRLLGSDYRIRTSLFAIEPPVNGDIKGGLYVVGRGDPSFSTKSGLKSLVSQLVAKGVKRVSGGLIPLGTFRGTGLGNGWEWQDLQEDYAAIASAFTLNENVIDWTIRPGKATQPVKFAWDNPELASGWHVQNLATTGSPDTTMTLTVTRSLGQKQLIVTGSMPENAKPDLGATAVIDPESHLIGLLKTEMATQGISVSDSLSPFKNTSPQLELATVESPPLQDLVIKANKFSNNFYAESFLRILGTRSKQGAEDSGDRGLKVIASYLKELGIPSTSILLADGSGLSRQNLVTPKAMVQLLGIMSKEKSFRDSLAIAGVDGTLANRFKNTLAVGTLRGKTGNLSGVVALAGYLKPKDYDELAFSITINNSNQSGKELREYVDAIALLLTRLHRC